MASTAGVTGSDGRLSGGDDRPAEPPADSATAHPASPGDAVRLRRLHDTGMLDGAYPSLDRLARAAAHQLRAMRAQVCLVAADRLIVAGRAGPPLEHSLCRMVVDLDAPLLVSDARTDERVAGHPAVGDGVITYAGFPVRSADGYPLGAFCVIDEQPREWEPRELLLIEDLAAAAESEIALRTANRELAGELGRARGVLEGAHDAYLSIDEFGVVKRWNRAAEHLFGYPAEAAEGRAVADLIIPERFRDAHAAGLARLHAGGPSTMTGLRIELFAQHRDGHEFPIEMMLQLEADGAGPSYHAFLHDIGDRAAERRQLEHERMFLQALLDSLDVGVAACDADGRLTQFNRAMRDLHHSDVRQLDQGEWASAFDLFTEDGEQLPADRVPLIRAFAGETVVGQHLVVAPPGAPPRTYHANARPIESSDGRRLGAVVAMHDITANRRAERLRELRLAVARALAEAASGQQAASGVVAAIGQALGWTFGRYWQAGPDGALTRLGDWAAGGYDLDELLTHVPDTLPPGEGLAGQAWRTGSELWLRDAHEDPRGGVVAEQLGLAGLRTVIAIPVRSDDRVLGVLVFFSATDDQPDDELRAQLDAVCAYLGRHVERRRAEELALELAAARRDFERVIERVHDYLWTVEVRPDRTVLPLYGSQDQGGDLGTAWDPGDRVHDDDRAASDRFRAQLVAGEPAESEIRMHGTDGVTRWVWTRAVPRFEDGRLLADGISTDVTDRRELAEQRERLLADQQEQNRRLRHLDRLKDELVALVSHELRNPLGAIRGYCETLLDDPELTGEQRHLAEVVDRRSTHMQTLVDDLLDMARLDAGQLQIDPKPIPAARLIRDVAQAQAPAADAKSLRVTVDVPRHLLVHADPVRLRQVLDNLVGNAVKYTPPGGAVTVTARHTPSEPDEGLVTVTVADTGIGIPDDQYAHLFDRFFRASNAVQQGIKGTGLGLAITKAIVEAHGGTLGAAPAAGGGTVFTLTLRAA